MKLPHRPRCPQRIDAVDSAADTRPTRDNHVDRGLELLRHAGPAVGRDRTGLISGDLALYEQSLGEGEVRERFMSLRGS